MNGITQRSRAVKKIIAIVSVISVGFFGYECGWLPGQKSQGGEGMLRQEIARWKTYRNEGLGFEVRYPENLVRVSEEGEKIVMVHSIPFEHPNFCDGTGEAPPLKELTDFTVSFKIFHTNLKETVIATQGDYLTSNFLEGDKLKIVPHFIDKFEIASLKGYRITIGAEGCGLREHYFPLNANNTLLVTRHFFPEFSPIIKDYQKYLTLPGIIPPNNEEELFNQVLSTFRFLK